MPITTQIMTQNRHIGDTSDTSDMSSRLAIMGGPPALTLGREAADVQAITAHVVALDEGRALAERLGADNGQQSRHTGTDDDEVVPGS